MNTIVPRLVTGLLTGCWWLDAYGCGSVKVRLGPFGKSWVRLKEVVRCFVSWVRLIRLDEDG